MATVLALLSVLGQRMMGFSKAQSLHWAGSNLGNTALYRRNLDVPFSLTHITVWHQALSLMRAVELKLWKAWVGSNAPGILCPQIKCQAGRGRSWGMLRWARLSGSWASWPTCLLPSTDCLLADSGAPWWSDVIPGCRPHMLPSAYPCLHFVCPPCFLSAGHKSSEITAHQPTVTFSLGPPSGL